MEKLQYLKPFNEFDNRMIYEGLGDAGQKQINRAFLNMGKIPLSNGKFIVPLEIVKVVSDAISWISSEFRTYYTFARDANIIYVINDPSCKTMAVDQYMNMYMDVLFIYSRLQMNPELVAAVIMHEIFHVVYNHIERGKNWLSAHGKPMTEFRDTNLAGDIEVNMTLTNKGIISPEDLVGKIHGLYLSKKHDVTNMPMETILENEKLMEKLRAMVDGPKDNRARVDTSSDWDDGYKQGWDAVANILDKFGPEETIKKLKEAGIIDEQGNLLKSVTQDDFNNLKFLTVLSYDGFLCENEKQSKYQSFDDGWLAGVGKAITLINQSISDDEVGMPGGEQGEEGGQQQEEDVPNSKLKPDDLKKLNLPKKEKKPQEGGKPQLPDNLPTNVDNDDDDYTGDMRTPPRNQNGDNNQNGEGNGDDSQEGEGGNGQGQGKKSNKQGESGESGEGSEGEKSGDGQGSENGQEGSDMDGESGEGVEGEKTGSGQGSDKGQEGSDKGGQSNGDESNGGQGGQSNGDSQGAGHGGSRSGDGDGDVNKLANDLKNKQNKKSLEHGSPNDSYADQPKGSGEDKNSVGDTGSFINDPDSAFAKKVLKNSGYSDEDINNIIEDTIDKNKRLNTPEAIKDKRQKLYSKLSPSDPVKKLLKNIEVSEEKYQNIWKKIMKKFLGKNCRRAGNDVISKSFDWKDKKAIALGRFAPNFHKEAQEPQMINIYVDVSGSVNTELLEVIAKSLCIFCKQFNYSGINIIPWASTSNGIHQVESISKNGEEKTCQEILGYISEGVSECGGGTDLIRAFLPQIVSISLDKKRQKRDDKHIIITDGQTGGEEKRIEELISNKCGSIVCKNCFYMIYDAPSMVRESWDEAIEKGTVIYVDSNIVIGNK
jgi:predicted metal-dependent peptidase